MPMMTLVSIVIIAVVGYMWVKDPSIPLNGIKTLPQRLADLFSAFRR